MDYKSLLIFIFLISSCSSIDVAIEEPIKNKSIDENLKFETYLNEDWEIYLNEKNHKKCILKIYDFKSKLDR